VARFLVVLALTVMAGLFVDLHPHFEIERCSASTPVRLRHLRC
jgi:hypothetical protein